MNRAKRMKRIKKTAGGIFFWIAVLLILLFFIYPLFWLVSTSLKNYIDAFAVPPKLVFTPTLENYQNVLGRADFFKNMLNSAVCALCATLVSTVLGVPCAYAIAMMRFHRAKDVNFFFLSARIAPPMMSLLPMYIIFSNLNLVGTRVPIIVIYILLCLPVVVWIMPVYFREVPYELREAAIIDGCDETKVFTKIMLPLVRGSVAATAIYCIILTWNEFLVALIMSSKGCQTLPVAVTSFMTFQGTEWGPLSAAGTIIMVPMMVFGFFIQKYFAKGMVSGSVKG